MNYIEEEGNVFDEKFLADPNIFFAQCISADFAMGAGIAVEFNNYFCTKQRLIQRIGTYVPVWDSNIIKGSCIREGRVLNLITKRNYWNKPTLQQMRYALDEMKTLAEEYNIETIVMPKIGCGIDRLSWSNVSILVQDVFDETNINIIVRHL